MNYTEKYHLPQWEEEDRIMRADFNRAMEKIDAGLDGNAQAAQEAAKLPYVIGNYTGIGHAAVEINLGFQPRVVLVFKDQQGDRGYSPAGRFAAASPTVSSNGRFNVTETGFSIPPYLKDDPEYPALNNTGDKYTYIAFR